MEDCKICKVCKESKPLSAFSDRFGGSGKLVKRTDCKACRALVEKRKKS